ncbi:MAG: hypothetical protein WAK60_01365 [Sedimentisphaerales bacterium]
MAAKLVTIANFAFGPDPSSEAELAKIKLEVEGIPCFLAGKNFIATYWLLSGVDCGIKLQVKETDVKRALEILGRNEQISIEENLHKDSTPETIALRCPVCGCEDIEYEKFSKKTFYLSILFLRFPLPLLKKHYRCNKCGHIWK